MRQSTFGGAWGVLWGLQRVRPGRWTEESWWEKGEQREEDSVDGWRCGRDREELEKVIGNVPDDRR